MPIKLHRIAYSLLCLTFLLLPPFYLPELQVNAVCISDQSVKNKTDHCKYFKRNSLKENIHDIWWGSNLGLLQQSYFCKDSVILSKNISRAVIKMKMTKRRLIESISNILLFNVYTAKHVTDMFQVPKQQLTQRRSIILPIKHNEKKQKTNELVNAGKIA